MSTQLIQIRGARTHNLKNIDLDLPRDRLIVFTGLSGSGKSSLAFDTLYAEGQRRYVESLSAYARQFLSMMDKPDVDHIEGLSPAISIEQKSTSHNPRSTVGTVTEIHDYLRLLYARAGIPRCANHGTPLQAQSVSQMVDQVLALKEDTRVMLLAPVIKSRKGEHAEALADLRARGFVRVRIDGKTYELDETPKLNPKQKHDIDAVIDRLKIRSDIAQRLAESFETALELGDGVAHVAFMDEPKKALLVFSNKFACPKCGYSITELEPRLFSFNNPIGACAECDGLGVRRFFDVERIVRNPNLSLAGGAIRGWGDHSAFYHDDPVVANHYKFGVTKPWNQLPRGENRARGSGEEKIQFRYENVKGNKWH
jgi:excinuclease ABC subunit A